MSTKQAEQRFASSSTSTPALDAARPQAKPRGRRRDRDCVTCKSRGLKCDLNRPQCLPCVQAGLSCGGYQVRFVWQDQRQSSASASGLSTRVRVSKLSRKAAPIRSAPPASASPSASSTSSLSSTACPASPSAISPASSTSSAQSAESPNILSPTATPDSYPTTEKSWSETDQNSLIKRLAALCNQILTSETQRTAPASDDNITSRAEQELNPKSAGPAYPLNQELISPTTANASSIYALKNQYLSLPETTGLLSDLCVFIQARLEGRGLALRQQPHDSLEMVKHRLAALAHVNRAIDAANPFAFLGIATFAVFEVCDDTTFGEWQRHLYGARHLLDYHHCQSLADLQRLAAMVPGLMDILARLVWFDVSGAVVHVAVDGPLLSSVNECIDGHVENKAADLVPPLIGATTSLSTPARPGLIFDDWHRQVLLDDEFFATVGVSADACALYVDVAKARLAQHSTRACLRATEQLLRVAAAPGLSDWELAVNVNRCAAAVALLQQARRARRVSPNYEANTSPEENLAWKVTLAAAVDKLCAALAATPASSRFYIHLAVGAYVAGMQVRTQEHCAVIRQYWRNCNVRGISRYPGGLARCEEHWRRIGLPDDAKVETGATAFGSIADS
ncbi:hypothetical protein SEPCBS57363_001435 [Sporothrix epigloea]|uniref:Zn(2)-C6 fungal-type domain-containing protein n=1 Tax=Sporothrix epigloea TaxID=1892477 RepID=A0ABP0DCU4_9PEZI